MSAAKKQISVCICTYQRPQMLERLLQELSRQETGEQFTFSIVVADNDYRESARPVVERFAKSSQVPVRYCVEPEQNIALARNKAIENAAGDYVAFIDDDEEPSPGWLGQLVEAVESYQADGVLGPVFGCFLTPPPGWIVRGKFFDRPSPPSGTWLRWDQTRSGNMLLRKRIFDDPDNRFDREYGGGGEDLDFFRRAIAKGMRFAWCAGAVVHEIVPPERWRRSYLIRRALLRGRAPYNQRWQSVVTSFLAVPTYALILPVVFLLGHHIFMRYLIRACDHVGRLLTVLGFDVIKERYVSQ